MGGCAIKIKSISTEVEIPSGAISDATLEEIIANFHDVYEQEYTYRLDAPVELVTYHLIAFAEVDKLTPEKQTASAKSASDVFKGQREVDYLEAGIHTATIYDGNALESGMGFSGPAVVEEADTTVVILPGMECSVDSYGNYQISIK